MNRWLSIPARVAGIIFLIYGAYGNRNPFFLELIQKLYAGRFEFLTIIGLHLTILTIIIALIESMLDLSLLLIGVALPIEILITVLFWGLYFYNPELLISKRAIQAGLTIPWSINIAQHLAPALFLAVEFALISRKFEYSRSHVTCITAVSVGYFAWMHFLFSKNKRWVYPFIHALNNWQRGLLLFASWCICYLAYQSSIDIFMVYFLSVLVHWIATSYHRAAAPSLRKNKKKFHSS